MKIITRPELSLESYRVDILFFKTITGSDSLRLKGEVENILEAFGKPLHSKTFHHKLFHHFPFFPRT